MKVKIEVKVNFKHLNDEHQNDLNVKLFDVHHSNIECQNDTNVEHQNV